MSEDRRPSKPLILVLGLLFYGGIGLAIAWNTSRGRAFLESRWPWVLGVVALLLVSAAIPAVRRKVEGWAPKGQVALVIFIVIPISLLALGLVTFLFETWRITLFRTLFLLVVCLLPAFMYYLFVATRRYSLLNEFLTNLNRLGLLERQWTESEDSKQRRLLSYIQKFQAVYGPLPQGWVGSFVETPDADLGRMHPEEDQTSLEGIFSTETTIPVIFATVLIVLGWIMTLPPVALSPQPGAVGPAVTAPGAPAASSAALPGAAGGGSAGGGSVWRWLDDALVPVETPIHFAFLGAYFFSLQLLFRRYVRRDLGASAYVNFAMRIVLAIIGTWVIVYWLNMGPDFGIGQIKVSADNLKHEAYLVIGFVIGAFPRIVWQVVLSVSRRTFQFAIAGLTTDLPLSDLDGLNLWHEARLEEEDIENMPSMASADIVELLIHTRFPTNRLIDWVDQALLYTQLGPGKTHERERLRQHGVLTATSLLQAYEKSGPGDDRSAFEEILGDGNGRSPMKALVETLQINPNLDLVKRWKRSLPRGDRRFEE